MSSARLIQFNRSIDLNDELKIQSKYVIHTMQFQFDSSKFHIKLTSNSIYSMQTHQYETTFAYNDYRF